ncbi:MAG TPA: MFS transporter [Gemmatimonadaceae bacterium]|nr:MFS transporter [Gemmatimonadaceae bacterium]
MAFVLALASVSANVDRQILSLLVRPIERDFGITDTQMSYLQGLAFALFYTALGIPIAWLADRANRRNIIATGTALWSLFTTLSATAKTYSRLFLMRVGVGVGEATLSAPGVSLLADYFPRSQLGRAMSVYALGVFFGSGLGYLFGALVVGHVDIAGTWHLPVLGDIRPWQAAFVAVGLPGFVIALLLLTVREPARQTPAHAQARFSDLMRYVSRNRWTYVTHSVGFGVWAMVNYGIAAWIPTLFRRTYDWPESDTGRIMGILTMTIGVLGVLAGGWIADAIGRRGRIDGPWLVAIAGAIGMLISATLFPLAPNAVIAFVGLAVVNFFAAFPWGAASAAAAEMAPPHLRAQGAALYFFVSSLLSGTLGPTSVALFTDHVFGRDGVRYSLATNTAIGMTIALALFAAGLGSYRRTVEERDAWVADDNRTLAALTTIS